jgi:hypothetical protein
MDISIFPSDCLQKKTGDYTLVKYPASKKNQPEYSLFRSVIYSNGVPVCFSPPKSLSPEAFETKYPNISSCVVEEFVEGTMINYFFDPTHNTWVPSTRTIVGAENTFDSEKTFSEMFYECLSSYSAVLNPSYIYSFVIQHPDNYIITPVHTPTLYLVAIYSIVNGQVMEISIDHFDFPIPLKYSVSSYEEAERLAQTVNGKGIVIKCNGERMKYKRVEYYKKESIKGNTSFPYHYLFLRKTPPVSIEYLHHFPYYISKANDIEQQIHRIVHLLYEQYVSCYIKRENRLATYDTKKYLYELHQLYLTTLRPWRMNITTVTNYVNALHPNQIMTILRVVRTSPNFLNTLDMPE